MRKFKWAGVAVYAPTPLTETNRLNIDEFKKHLKFVASGGCDIIIPGGAAGQQISLSWDEHCELIKAVVKTLGDEIFCVAYSSSPYTDEAIQRTRDAQRLGAHAVNLLAPWYTLPTVEEIYLHFKKIAEAVDMPITLYNNERRPNVSIPWSVTVRLAKEHKNIVGTKEANPVNAYYILAELSKARPDFTVINGMSEIFVPHFMALGGSGTFTWIDNVAPGMVTVPLYRALLQGNMSKAKEIVIGYRDLIDLFIATDPVPVSLHFMLNSMGWKMGIPRAPYSYPPSKENQEKYLSVMKKYDLIK
jgi:4-hydroxy-tetrahydrodipicolinate synthase